MIICVYRNNFRTWLIKYWFSVTSSIHLDVLPVHRRTNLTVLVTERLGRRVLVSEIKGFQCLVSIFAFEFSFVIIIESGHFKYFKIFKSFLEPIGVITRYLIALFELFQVNFEWSHDFWQIFAILTKNMAEHGLRLSYWRRKWTILRTERWWRLLENLFSLIWNENKARVTL